MASETQSIHHIDDVRWLISDKAAPWLIEANQDHTRGIGLINTITRLRKKITAPRASLVTQQILLRERAKTKFANASTMFFHDKGMQQATGDNIGRYKAKRFNGAPTIWDLCCGIGGDLIHLAKVTTTRGVDLDSGTCLLAEANCRVNSVDAIVMNRDVIGLDIAPLDWIHIDPDRRPHQKRTTRPEFFEPSIEDLQAIRQKHANLAIKLAPASRLPANFSKNCELEWIGDRRETKQQVCWFGNLAREQNSLVATVVDANGEVLGQYRGTSAAYRPPVSSQLGEYVYDLHSTVIASRLLDQFATEFGLEKLSDGASYMTGRKIDNALASRFAVVEVSSLDRKKLESMLHAHEIGRLEIKRRGVEQTIQDQLGKMKLNGHRSATILLTKVAGRGIAILANRESDDESNLIEIN